MGGHVWRRGVLFVLATLIGLGATTSAFASIVRALDLVELVAKSDIIIVGQVTRVTVSTDAYSRTVSDAELHVRNTWKGSAQEGSSVVVRALGGTKGGDTLRVIGEPTFASASTVVLFGRRSPNGAYYRPVGMAQGVLRVRVRPDGGADAIPTTEGLALVAQTEDGKLVPRAGAFAGAIDLKMLGERVQAEVRHPTQGSHAP